MTAVEREAAIAHRRARGFPLHKPPHLHLGEGWYFITAATFEHRRHFAAPGELTALAQRLLEAFQSANLPCAAWVVLPNHYHALIEAPKINVVGKALGAVHGRSGRYANKRDQTPGRQVWYKFSDRKVRSDRHFWACLHYVIYNPVKHGYGKDMGEWAWSSYAELLEQRGKEWVEDLSREYPLGDFGEGWDL